MITRCPNCGKEFDDYWGYKFFLGKSGTIIICGECYRIAQDKVDSNLAIQIYKKNKARLK